MGPRTAAGVSVVIPVYNRAEFVRAAVESAFGQTLRPASVIVVDDGSTDDPASVLEDLPIVLLRRPNGGTAAASTTGLEAVETEFTALMGSDDLLEPTYLETCVGHARRTGAAVVGSDASFLSVSSKHQRTVFASVRFPLQHHEQKMQVLRRNLLTGAALYRTDVVRKLGTWDEDRWLAGAEDYDFLVRAVHSGQLLGFVDRPLYVIRVHPGRQSANRVRSLRARVAALQKFEDGGPEVRFLREAQRSIREADRRINAYRSSSVLRSSELGRRRHVALWWALSMPQFRRRRLGLLAAALGPPTFSGRALARIIGPDAA